ncbi:MAG: amino acid ABC transporter permease [Angelakisella sp.]
MNFAAMAPWLVYFQQGVIYTILLSLCTVAIGFVLALLLALMRISNLCPFRFLSKSNNSFFRLLSRFNPISFLAGAYIEVFRCTPMLVQLYLIFFVVFGGNGLTAPEFTLFGFIQGGRFIPGIVALSLNSAAYVAEIVRAGIQGIDYGQTEAARSLGLTKLQTMWHIVLPQAIRNILPAIANEFVVIIKESSVCSVLGMQEIMYNAKLVQGATFMPVEPLVIAAGLYFCLTFPASKVIQYFERRMSRGYQR